MPARRAAPEAAPPHDLMAESDESLVAAAERIFEGDLEPAPEPDLSKLPPSEYDAPIEQPMNTGSPEPEHVDFGRPDRGDMITVRGGGLYLPVRRRVGWMRGLPEPHPDWTIETFEIKVIEGKFSGSKVEGGYARIGARVFDSTGRLISTGTKTEYSERFLDFVEKAETGAIGRALAVAGYGTEAAVDLDEGYEQDRIADAPVTPSRPINITPSAVPGVRPGGRPEGVQKHQIAEIGRLNKSLGIGTGLVQFLEVVKGVQMPPLEPGKENQQMTAFLNTFTNDEAGQVVQMLTKALKDQQAKAAEVSET